MYISIRAKNRLMLAMTPVFLFQAVCLTIPMWELNISLESLLVLQAQRTFSLIPLWMGRWIASNLSPVFETQHFHRDHTPSYPWCALFMWWGRVREWPWPLGYSIACFYWVHQAKFQFNYIINHIYYDAHKRPAYSLEPQTANECSGFIVALNSLVASVRLLEDSTWILCSQF